MEITSTIIMASIPVIAIHVGLMIYALRLINKNRKTRLLPAIVWVIIIIFIQIFGSLAYLILEKTNE